MFKKIHILSVSAAALLGSVLASNPAKAADVFNSFTGTPTPSADVFHTAYGFAYESLGDDVTIATAPTNMGYQVNSVTMDFAVVQVVDDISDGPLYGSGDVHNYTPDLQLSIYAINPTTRLPVGPALASATENTVTFDPVTISDPPGSPTYPYSATPTGTTATFTFTSPTILPKDFAVVYTDLLDGTDSENTVPNNNLLDADFFGVIGTDSSFTPTVGSTDLGTLVNRGTFLFNDSNPSDDPNTWGVGNNYFVQVDASLVTLPEPTSLVLVGVSGVLLLRRRARRGCRA